VIPTPEERIAKAFDKCTHTFESSPCQECVAVIIREAEDAARRQGAVEENMSAAKAIADHYCDHLRACGSCLECVGVLYCLDILRQRREGLEPVPARGESGHEKGE
jgi:hypothetical protein